MTYSRVLQQLTNYSLYWNYKTTRINRHLHKCSYKIYIPSGTLFSTLKKYKWQLLWSNLKINKPPESGYYLVKWTSDQYTSQSSHKTGRDVIKDGDLLCDALYLNKFATFKQWYNPYEKKLRKFVFGLNTVVLTKVKVQSTNDVFPYW